MFVAAVAFVFIFGGALLGIFLRKAFPEHHLNSDTRDVVRVLSRTKVARSLKAVLIKPQRTGTGPDYAPQCSGTKNRGSEYP